MKEMCNNRRAIHINLHAYINFLIAVRFQLDTGMSCTDFCTPTHHSRKPQVLFRNKCIKLELLKHSVTQWVTCGSRDSSVGIAASYGLDDRGVGIRVLVGQEFSLLQIVQTGSEVHATWVPGALSPGVKRPEREVYHSPPTSAEIKKI
jgi:hypothetical protein